MPNHKHYFGFCLPLSVLRTHVHVEHELEYEEIDEIADLEAWHTAQHPEITIEEVKPTIEELTQQLLLMQSAVDDLVLDSLLN